MNALKEMCEIIASLEAGPDVPPWKDLELQDTKKRLLFLSKDIEKNLVTDERKYQVEVCLSHYDGTLSIDEMMSDVCQRYIDALHSLQRVLERNDFVLGK